jgi:hypothetical protein
LWNQDISGAPVDANSAAIILSAAIPPFILTSALGFTPGA